MDKSGQGPGNRPAVITVRHIAALTLMLRSQQIPARMVVGFKCDEWNSMGGYYQVRQEFDLADGEAKSLTILCAEWSHMDFRH